MNGRVELEASLNKWMQKVLNTYDAGLPADTYRMIKDVDAIIAEAFDHDRVITE